MAPNLQPFEHARQTPEKVILFGSHASGAAGADSDVDLLVVMPLTASKAHHEIEIRAALRACRVPKDVIVTTPEAKPPSALTNLFRNRLQ